MCEIGTFCHDCYLSSVPHLVQISLRTINVCSRCSTDGVMQINFRFCRRLRWFVGLWVLDFVPNTFTHYGDISMLWKSRWLPSAIFDLFGGVVEPPTQAHLWLHRLNSLDFRISQGSVAIYCRWGGNLCGVCIENFLTNQLVKEFWKSVHICQCYYQISYFLRLYTQCWGKSLDHPWRIIHGHPM